MKLAEQCQLQKIQKQNGKNFTALHAGKFADLSQYELQHPLRDKPTTGKLFLKDHMNLNSMQVSLNRLPAGIAVPFYHKHKENEELYIFVKGKGQVQVDGENIDVEEGSCIRISPDGLRTWRNNGSEDLYYVVIQGKSNSLLQDTFDDGLPGETPVKW